MEDSIKGYIISFAMIGIFILGILNFVFLFPQEQGFTFSSIDNETFAVLNNVLEEEQITNLDDVYGTINNGTNNWNIEVGFMGSNTMSANKGASINYFGTVMNMTGTLINEVFSTSNGNVKHPVIIIFGIFVTLGTLLGIYLFIKFIRTGN